LKGCRTIEDLENALTELPKDLDITYDRILNNIDEKDRKRAQCVLQLMAVACRPLTIDEASEALTVDIERENINYKRRMRDPSAILEICSSLIELAGCVFT
jgi:ankyrin repeat domain-containing protein 50